MDELEKTTLPIGTPVRAYPATRPRHGREVKTVDSVTTSEPWLLGGHTWVVLLAGYPGAIALSHVDVRGRVPR